MPNPIKQLWQSVGWFFPIILVFAGLMVAVHGMGYINRAEAIGNYRLDLTTEGCRYAKAMHLKVIEADTCSVTARFHRFAVAPGGRLYNEDGTTTEITAAMLLGSTELKTDLPMSENEVAERWQGWIEEAIGFAMMIFALTLMGGYWTRPKRGHKTA